MVDWDKITNHHFVFVIHRQFAGVVLCFSLINTTPSVVCLGADAEGGPLSEDVDLHQLSIVWKSLGNEALMYPLDMGDVAVKIGLERQLFLDNYLIAKTLNIKRQVHHPVRSKHNPMFDDQRIWWLQHVMQFDESPRFRMWYNPDVNFHPWKENEKIRFVTAYAVSEDGVNWTRPHPDLYQIPNYPYGNVTLPYGMMQGIFYEPWEEDPLQRFKALVCVEAKRTVNGRLTKELTIREGYYLHTSPDGIHWKGDLKNLVMPAPVRYGLPLSGIGDTSRFWWDSIRKKYMGGREVDPDPADATVPGDHGERRPDSLVAGTTNVLRDRAEYSDLRTLGDDIPGDVHRVPVARTDRLLLAGGSRDRIGFGLQP